MDKDKVVVVDECTTVVEHKVFQLELYTEDFTIRFAKDASTPRLKVRLSLAEAKEVCQALGTAIQVEESKSKTRYNLLDDPDVFGRWHI